MESEFEPKHDLPETEPVFEIVEGDAQDAPSDKSIVPNAFERTLEKYETTPKYVETEAPPYKNRAFIAVVCVVAGIVAGRLTTQPKVETRVVTKEVPVATQAIPEKTEAPVPKVDKAFRELANLGEFDPWQPLNGGFPLPPKTTQANIVARSGGAGAYSGPPPAGLSGSITPLDPSDFGGNLPAIGGPAGTGANLPNNPVPGGGTTGGNVKVVDSGHATPGGEHYTSISMNGPEPEQGQGSIVSIAASLGGSARTFTHMSEGGTVEAKGVLVIVPAAKYEEAKSKIEALGGASVDSTYDGLASDRQSQIQAMLTSRLTKLQDRRKDLLVDFLDDAAPVKQINEAIDLETRAVSATRLPGGMTGKAVIRVILK